MFIRLSSLYQNTSGVRIPAGDYSINDPVLCGLGPYLVASQQAVRLAMVEETSPVFTELTVNNGEPKEPEKVKEDPENTGEGGETVIETVEETVDLSTLTKKGLIELAAKRGIELGNAPEKKTNAELIALIETANLGTPIEPTQGEGGAS